MQYYANAIPRKCRFAINGLNFGKSKVSETRGRRAAWRHGAGISNPLIGKGFLAAGRGRGRSLPDVTDAKLAYAVFCGAVPGWVRFLCRTMNYSAA
jgi:hypothetical protein